MVRGVIAEVKVFQRFPIPPPQAVRGVCCTVKCGKIVLIGNTTCL